MLYFLLPNTHPHVIRYLTCEVKEEMPPIELSPSFAKSLNAYKDLITHQEHEWDTYKKYTNPYEFIHTAVPYQNHPISKIRPLSRAYYKFIEIWNLFQFSFPSTTPIRSFHLAEGPGSFIEALASVRQNPSDKYYGMTLENGTDKTAPNWRRIQHVMRTFPNIVLERGIDGTGNILSLHNFDYCSREYGNTMDLITADGGFDFSNDFNAQEMVMASLLFAQVAFAIAMQKENGCFVLKIFDCFMAHTLDILVLLSSLYRECYVTKPLTSRFGNSEKYIVCKHFIPSSSALLLPFLRGTFFQVTNKSTTATIHRFLSSPISLYFVKRMEEYNSVFAQQQIETIHNTLLLIKNKNRTQRKEALMASNLHKCILWCIKNGVAYEG